MSYVKTNWAPGGYRHSIGAFGLGIGSRLGSKTKAKPSLKAGLRLPGFASALKAGTPRPQVTHSPGAKTFTPGLLVPHGKSLPYHGTGPARGAGGSAGGGSTSGSASSYGYGSGGGGGGGGGYGYPDDYGGGDMPDGSEMTDDGGYVPDDSGADPGIVPDAAAPATDSKPPMSATVKIGLAAAAGYFLLKMFM